MSESTATSKVTKMSDEDKLWQIYLHTLSAYHSNIMLNKRSPMDIAEHALKCSKKSLLVWKSRELL